MENKHGVVMCSGNVKAIQELQKVLSRNFKGNMLSILIDFNGNLSEIKCLFWEFSMPHSCTSSPPSQSKTQERK